MALLYRLDMRSGGPLFEPHRRQCVEDTLTSANIQNDCFIISSCYCCSYQRTMYDIIVFDVINITASGNYTFFFSHNIQS